METLFITRPLVGTYVFLNDANGFKLGTFKTVDDAKAWCEENGYRWRE